MTVVDLVVSTVVALLQILILNKEFALPVTSWVLRELFITELVRVVPTPANPRTDDVDIDRLTKLLSMIKISVTSAILIQNNSSVKHKIIIADRPTPSLRSMCGQRIYKTYIICNIK